MALRIQVLSRARAHVFATMLMVAASIALGGISVGLGYLNPTELMRARATIDDLLSPVYRFVSSPLQTFQDLNREINVFFEMRHELQTMQVAITKLDHLQARAIALEHENHRLRELLENNHESLVDHDNKESSLSVTHIARSVADLSSPFAHSLLLDSGTKYGITRYDVALLNGGLAGWVINAGTNSSRLLLITDISSRIPVEVGENRVPGIVIGTGTPFLKLDYIYSHAMLEPNDLVVTSGGGGVFPSGLPVGVLSDFADVAKGKNDLNGDEFYVHPFANPDVASYFKIIANTPIMEPVAKIK